MSGVRLVLLNGRLVGPILAEQSEHELALGDLAPRNELVIEAEPPDGDAEWGIVSLVFG
jgi:hypothetical protein